MPMGRNVQAVCKPMIALCRQSQEGHRQIFIPVPFPIGCLHKKGTGYMSMLLTNIAIFSMVKLWSIWHANLKQGPGL